MDTHFNPYKLSLDKRLNLVASMVREGVSLADIGTDHAYLPVSLILSKKITSAIAADIGEGPLNSAKKTIEKYKLQDKIKTILSDGLKEFTPDMCDDIVIAGMGGELIADIIEQAQWLKDQSKHLVLQPMTMQKELREYLFNNGYYIDKEQAVIRGHHAYTVMSVYFSGEKLDYNDVDYYVGKLDSNLNEAEKTYIQIEISKLKNKLIGYKHSGNIEEYEKLKHTITKLKELLGE